MAKPGTFTGALPPRRAHANTHDWDDLCRKAQERPGEALLAAQDVPVTLAKSIRGRTRAPFVREGGSLLVNVRNSTEGDDGRRYGDIFFTWIEDNT